MTLSPVSLAIRAGRLPPAPLLLAASSSRGLVTFWILFVFGIAGTLFPNLLAADFLDEPGVVRWLAVPLLLASGVLLYDYYWGLPRAWLQ